MKEVKKQGLILVTLIACLTSSCHKRKGVDEYATVIDMGENYKNSFALSETDLPTAITIYDTVIITMDYRNTNGFISFYSQDSMQLIKRIGKLGKGANEFVAPVKMKIDKPNRLLWFYEFPQKALFYVSLDSVLLNMPFTFHKVAIADEVVRFMDYSITDDVNILIPSADKTCLFYQLDSIGNYLMKLGEPTVFKNTYPEMVYSELNISYPIVVDDNCYLFYYNLDLVKKYNLNNGNVQEFELSKLNPSSFRISENGYLVTTLKTKLFYHNPVIHYENMLLCRYLGETCLTSTKQLKIPSKIICSDINNLEPKYSLQFNHPVESFSIDEQNNLIYVIDPSDTELIKTYELPI